MCVLIMWATLVDNKIHVLQRNFILLQNMFLVFRGVIAPNVNLLKAFGVKCVYLVDGQEVPHKHVSCYFEFLEHKINF